MLATIQVVPSSNIMMLTTGESGLYSKLTATEHVHRVVAVCGVVTLLLEESARQKRRHFLCLRKKKNHSNHEQNSKKTNILVIES